MLWESRHDVECTICASQGEAVLRVFEFSKRVMVGVRMLAVTKGLP